ncbi:hypothetical protein ACFOZ7_13310 [Natribaculum luteum]|uniref:Uncharacterized protein n=1 Tax=Natribaculum luteum TaxID=1586232 RepID=A0ABD5P0U0_9EURY|nr:hypothetical protein [Natribaculum luteum]
MNDDTPDPDRLARVVTTIVNQPAWELTPCSDSVASALDHATTDASTRAELFFDHEGTDARLEVLLPSTIPGSLCDLLVRHSLDPGLTSDGGDFVDGLQRARAAIVTRNTHEYVQPVEDPSILLRATVPAPCTDRALENLFASLQQTVGQVADLHGRIRRPIERTISQGG